MQLQRLSNDYALSTKNFYDMSIKNEVLLTRVEAFKHERDLYVSLDERHKIEMLIVDTKDCHRRAERLE